MRWLRGLLLISLALLVGCGSEASEWAAATQIGAFTGRVVALDTRDGAVFAVVVDATAGRASLVQVADPPVELDSATLQPPTGTAVDGPGLLAAGTEAIIWASLGSGPRWVSRSAGPKDEAVALDGIYEGITQIDAGPTEFVWTRHGKGEAWAVADAPSPTQARLLATLEFPSGIAGTSHGAYVVDRLAASLWRFTDAGSGLVASWLGDNTMALAHDEQTLVFRNHAQGRIVRMPLPTGDLVELPQTNVESWGPIAPGPGVVYSAPFAEDARRAVLAWSHSGGDAESVGPVGTGCTPALGIDAGAVLFSDCAGGVWRRAHRGSD